jgi:F420-non-reducing hydrogenase small subunit
MGGTSVTLNLEWLSDCGGCHVAIVDLHEKILDVLGAVEIQHCPVLTDIKDYPAARVGLVSGAIRNEHDRHMAEAMRASCDLIVALGTCAVYGGIPGAGTVHSRAELLDAVYTRNRTTKRGAAPPDRAVSVLETGVVPLDEAIPVDLYLPGCPPHPTFIFQALRALIEKRAPVATGENVCAHCDRSMKKSSVATVRYNHDGVPEPDTCLLTQGYVCLGSVTLDRCLAPCPTNGTACTGCAGPSLQVLTEPNRDIRTEVADRMSRLTKIPRDAVVAHIERGAKSHYSYAMASRMIGGKPTFLVRQWIADAEAEA